MDGLLIDLDGVLYVQEKIIPGAVETVRFIQEKKIPHRFVTNTTSINRSQLATRLNHAGFAIQIDQLFTAPRATASYLRGLTNPRCYFFANDNLKSDFEGIELVDENPTHVVIGDMGGQFNHQNMNKLFKMVKDGAELVAFQKNRYWLTSDGITLDAGSYIAALEYATERPARVFGKPAKDFFLQACQSMELPTTAVVVIGDDYNVDIVGGHLAGLGTIFVRTGKDKERDLADEKIQPTMVIDSIAYLTNYLDSMR